MKQCLHCAKRMYFVPLPGEVFTCCAAHNEDISQIDLATGVSPAVKEHGIKGVLCEKFGAGKSICEPDKDKPFNLSSVRMSGEGWLKNYLPQRCSLC